MTEPKLLGKDLSRRLALRIIFGACFVVTAIAIFLFSSQSAAESSQTSGRFSSLFFSLYKSIFGDVAPEDLQAVRGTITFIVRKIAHFSVYALLALFASLFSLTFKWRGRLPSAFFVCLAYAVSDELHQYFVPGRAMRFYDIAIDSLGIISGIAIAYFCVKTLSLAKYGKLNYNKNV